MDPVTAEIGHRPGKVIALHLNYPSRAAERGRTPTHGSYFLKAPTSLSCSGVPVTRPAGTELLGFEGEIALVIGRGGRAIPPEAGWSHVGWVTAANDLGLYDLRYADRGSNLRSKSADGYTPVGPVLLPAAGLDPVALRVRTWVNGELVQEGSTATLLFPFAEIVADLSRTMTLEPGDVVLTGTPAGASVIVPGDVVEVEVDSIDPARPAGTGRLRSPIVEGPGLAGPGALGRVDDALRADAFGPAPPSADDLLARYGAVAVATVSAQLRRHGIENASVDGVHPARPGSRFAGRARTLRYLPLREDLSDEHGGGFNAQKRAVDSVRPGEVLVMEARGELDTGTVGDILALRAQVRGAAAIVTDGGLRDSAAVAAMDLPVFHGGAHPAVLGRRHVPWETDVAIGCGGTTVLPGDILVGDDDGVVVIPPAIAEDVLRDALEQERQERYITERVLAGASVAGLYPLTGRWKAAYEQWQDTTDPTCGEDRR